MSKFRYHERSADTVEKRGKQQGGNYDSYLNSELSFWKVKEGTRQVRILPPPWDPKSAFGDNWGIEIYVHRDIGPDNDVYLCIDEMRKLYGNELVPTKLGNCPLCEERGRAEEEELLKALKPGKQILCMIVDRDDQKAGPLVWRMGWQLERDIQLRSIDKKSGAVIPIDHPDRGYDISFTREGAGLKTKYIGVDVDRRDSPIHDKQRTQDDWLQFIQDHQLPDMLVFYDEEYLRSVYRGKKGSAKGDVEEDDRRSRAPSRSSREEPEDDSRGRGRGRDDTEEDDTRGRGRSRDDDPPPRRGRDSDPEDERDSRARDRDDPPPRRRAGRDDPADDDRLPNDREMAENTDRLRRRSDPDEDPAEEDTKDEPPPRRRASRDEPEEETDRRGGRGRDKDEPPARGGSAGKARESLERHRPKR